MVVAAIMSDILCFYMFSLDHVPLRVSAPQLSLVWAGTEFGNNLLPAVCEGASKPCLPATGSEPPAVRLPEQFPCCQAALAKQPHPQIFHTKCPNKYQEWCSSKPFTVWARKQNKTPCLDNHFWIKINTSSTHWVWLKKLMCSSSPDPAISVTSVLVAAILPSHTCPSHPSEAHCASFRAAVDWGNPMANLQGLTPGRPKRAMVNPH